jgi:hypothetical protein
MSFVSDLLGELRDIFKQDESAMFNPLRKDVLFSFVNYDYDKED